MTGRTKLLILIAIIAVVAFYLEVIYLGASSPSSVKATVYKVELMTGASDTKPQVVFSNVAGMEIDLAKDTDALIGQMQIPPGTYKRVRMTVTNGIRISIAGASDNPCGKRKGAFTDRIFPIAEGTAPDLQVPVDFATYEDSGGTWAGPRITHILLSPVTASENLNKQVQFKFSTANSLFCLNGAVAIRAPWAVWAENL